MLNLRFPITLVAAAAWAACGGPQPKAPTLGDEENEPESTGPVAPRPRQGGPSVDAEIGTLDVKAVNEVVRSLRKPFVACFADANAKMDLPVVGGDLVVSIRVTGEGSVRWAFLESSSVGSEQVENCVLGAVKAKTWPTPQGGKEALATIPFGRDPEGRAPVAWSSEDLGEPGAELRTKLAACKASAGTGALAVTLYVDPDGKPLAAGASVGDEKGVDATACAVAAARGLTYPSPGSYPAKVTVRAE